MVPFISLFTSSTVQTRGASRERLADLVHHLGDVPLSKARRAVRSNAVAARTDDPLEVIAGALVQLRNERHTILAPVPRV